MSDDEETRPAKRQRTETVSQTTLRKPFSSPLLQKSRPAAAVASPAAQSGPDKGPTTATAAAAAAPAPAESDTPSRVKHSDNPVRQSRRALENEIKAVRNELEVVAQAKRIIAGDQTRKVRELAQRWKMVAQTAAEAAFETLSPSINDMGSSRDLNGNVDGERPAWTMKELLMSLGIDPELLGYDEESEDWVKD